MPAAAAAPVAASFFSNPAVQSGIAGAVSGIAGGLFGRRKQKTEWDFKERKRLEESRFRWLAQGARNAGFNPLTVLQATGGAMAGVTPTVTESPLAVRNILAGAAASGLSAYLNYDPIEDETAKERLEGLKIANQLGRQQLGGPVSARAGSDGSIPTIADLSPHGRVDPHSTRPEDARIKQGPYANQYLWKNTAGDYLILPPGFTPAAMQEEMAGDLVGQGITLTDWVLGNGGMYVEYDPKNQVIYTPPKRPQTRPFGVFVESGQVEYDPDGNIVNPDLLGVGGY